MSKIRQETEYYRIPSTIEGTITNNETTQYSNINIIDTDLTIYVAADGSDITGTGLIGAPYASVQGALDYLGTLAINNNATVTIQLADGHYTHPYTIIENTYGYKLQIKGETNPDEMTFSFNGIVKTGIIPKNDADPTNANLMDVELETLVPLSAGYTQADIEVGDWIAIVTTAGTVKHQTLLGFFEVIGSGGASSTVIKFRGYNEDDALSRDITTPDPPPITMTGTFKVFKTVLDTARGFEIKNATSVKWIENLAIVDTNNSYSSIAIRTLGASNVYLRNIGTSGFQWGYVSESSSSMFPVKCLATNCTIGFDALINSCMWTSDCISTCCHRSFLVKSGSAIHHTDNRPSFISNCSIGSGCETNSYIGNNLNEFYYNDTAIWSNLGAIQRAGITGSATTFVGNTTDVDPLDGVQGNNFALNILVT